VRHGTANLFAALNTGYGHPGTICRREVKRPGTPRVGGGMRELRAGEPRAIGPYRIVGVIGAGGMGQVFLGIGPDGRLAAIKQIVSTLAENPTFRQRFVHEIDASRKVSGAFTAAIMDADPHAPSPWLASVFVPAPGLDSVVSEYGPLPEPVIRRLAVGLALALQEIHRAGLIHRDLKPGNVLLTDDGPRVIDFGIAHIIDAAHRLTRTGAVIGTPAYMSPEQLDDRPLTPASDVFALGAVLVYAATGRLPFGEAAHLLMYRLATAEPDLRDAPPALRPMLAACLHNDPTRRPTPQQLLHVIGPLGPADDWLPAPIHQLIHTHAEQARRLSGAPAHSDPHAARSTPTSTIPPGPTSVRQPLPSSPAPAATPRRRLRGWQIAVAVGAALVLGASVPFGIQAFTGPQGGPEQPGALPISQTPAPPTSQTPAPLTPQTPPPTSVAPPNTLDWTTLPPFTEPDDLLFSQSFATALPSWPTGRSNGADLEFRDGVYAFQPLDRTRAPYVTAPAPTETFLSDTVVTATAALQSGQGLWGVWCRGVDTDPSTAYLFLISHTAAVQITATGFQDGTGWKHLDGVDVSRPTTISARCADVPGASVELTMAVNGRQVLTYRPATVLSPGYSGVTMQPFGDVEGPIAVALFSEFQIRRYD
jgi:serine/threonine protein kinase